LGGIIPSKLPRGDGAAIWPARLSVKAVSVLMSSFSPSFSGPLVNASALTLLLETFAGKSYAVTAF